MSSDRTPRLLGRFMWWHLYRKGHSIRINRHITTALHDTSKGWLFRCECGEVWTR